MQGISWKDVLHYGSAVGLVMLGGLAMMGLQIPGVTIDPTICFTTAAGIFAAGLKGGATSGNGAAKVTVIKSLLFALADRRRARHCLTGPCRHQSQTEYRPGPG